MFLVGCRVHGDYCEQDGLLSRGVAGISILLADFAVLVPHSLCTWQSANVDGSECLEYWLPIIAVQHAMGTYMLGR
jgi:hypothetical protein